MRHGGRAVIWTTAILLILQQNNAKAIDFQSARTTGLANGGRAGALLSDSIIMNPSILGFYPIASVTGSLGWVNPNKRVRMFHLGAIDGRNEWFSAGASWTRAQKGDFIHLAVAKKILPIMSIGAHGKRMWTKYSGQEPEGKRIVAYDGGVSVTFGGTKEQIALPVQLALTADNLAHNAGYEKYLGPREYALGVKGNVNDIMILYFDYVQTQSRYGSFPTFIGSTEIALGNDFFIRGGYFGFHNKGYSAGAGWVGPKLGLNYGYQKQTETFRSTLHTATIDIYM